MFRKNPAKEPFIIDVAYLKDLSPDEAKFYTELAEKQLKDSIDTGKIITERATNLVTLSSGTLIALFAFCIDRWEKDHQIDHLMKVAIAGCIVLAIVSVLLIIAISPKAYCIPDANPKVLFQ